MILRVGFGIGVRDDHFSLGVQPPSPHPHPFQCSVQLGFSESHRPTDFVIGDEAGHAPAIEVAFADPEVDMPAYVAGNKLNSS